MEFRDIYFALLLYQGVNFIVEISVWVVIVIKFIVGIFYSFVNQKNYWLIFIFLCG